ncbi:MAG TPA: zinc ribbon domain-containing protein [Thermoanaerobaculia bacterium]|nr:zinc ribbon domain-containing protein [Thermoanaerobaculia bacterium]
MPLYEYRCRGCGERFEVLQRLGASGDDVPCPRCGEERPERVLSTFAAGGARAGADPAAVSTQCCRGPGFSCAN